MAFPVSIGRPPIQPVPEGYTGPIGTDPPPPPTPIPSDLIVQASTNGAATAFEAANPGTFSEAFGSATVDGHTLLWAAFIYGAGVYTESDFTFPSGWKFLGTATDGTDYTFALIGIRNSASIADTTNLAFSWSTGFATYGASTLIETAITGTGPLTLDGATAAVATGSGLTSVESAGVTGLVGADDIVIAIGALTSSGSPDTTAASSPDFASVILWTGFGADGFALATTETDDTTFAPAVFTFACPDVVTAGVGMFAVTYVANTGDIGGGTSVPGAPTGLTATASDGEVTLDWTAPSDNGSGITSYNVKRTGATISTGSGATSYTVTGLVDGTTYIFWVDAVNGIGTGADSATVSVTPESMGGGGSPTPVAPVTGIWVLVVDEEFDGVTSALVGNSDTLSSSGLASGSLALDRTMWSPFYFSEGGSNNGSATHAANIKITASVCSLLLPSSGSGGCLFGGGSSAGGSNFSINDFVSGHVGWVSSGEFLAEVRAFFVEVSGKDTNWGCPIYFTSETWPAGGELDLGEILSNGGGEVTITLHFGSSNSATQFSLGVLSGWHTISAHRTSSFIDIYLDGVLFNGNISPTPGLGGGPSGNSSHTYTTANGVSGTLGPWIPIAIMGGGSDGGPSNTPSSLQIDWFRIFEP